MTETAAVNLAAWSVQVGLLALVAAVVSRLVPVDAPVVRYAWWRAVLVVCLALPVIQPWQPAGLPPDPTALASDVAPGPGRDDAVAGDMAVPLPSAEPVAAPRWPTMLATLLVAGALVRLTWLFGGLMRLRRLRYAGVPADVPGADDLLQTLTGGAAEVRYVPALRQPVTFGLGRPVVLLPDAVRCMSPGVQRAVLAHESWHVRRRDWIWSLGEEALRALLWFHPSIWYLVSQVQAAREEVVDELSILSTNARRSYLEALLAFADEPAVYPAAPFARRRHLFTRMLLISREAAMSSRRVVASGAAMAGALIIAGWYGALAFPLTATDVAEPAVSSAPTSQAQPRDPRADTPRPATAREQELRAAISADPSNVMDWIELAKLQEQRGAAALAEETLASGMSATHGPRQLVSAMAAFFRRTGQFDKAVGVLEDAAARNPGDPAGHHLLATYYWEKVQKDASLTPAEKLMYLESGTAASDRALAQRPDYIEALTYKNILLRMKASLETDAGRQRQLVVEADALRTRAIELSRQRAAAGGTSTSERPDAPPPPPPPPPPMDFQVDGQQAIRIGGAVSPPRKIRDVRPVYPPEALDARVSGVVILEALIDASGAVRSARVLRSIPLLDQAALDAVQQWRFTPTLLNGAPTPVVITLTVNFVQ